MMRKSPIWMMIWRQWINNKLPLTISLLKKNSKMNQHKSTMQSGAFACMTYPSRTTSTIEHHDYGCKAIQKTAIFSLKRKCIRTSWQIMREKLLLSNLTQSYQAIS